MNISKVNNQQNTAINKNKKKSRNVGASIGASFLGSVVQTASVPLSLAVINTMKKIGSLPQDKIEIMHNAAEKALIDTGLSNKGAKIQYLERNKQDFKLPKYLRILNPIEQIKDGKNAAFVNKDLKNFITKKVIFPKNTILMPKRDISFAAFHEIGHALNYNFSKFGKILQHMRNPLMGLAGAIALYGAFTQNRKTEDGKELTKGQKFKNFVRNNAGKLSIAAMLPILWEEGMATCKGQKLANKLLSKDMAKIVSKGNKVAYLSYIIGVLSLGAASYASVKIKDYLVAKKAKKADNKVV